MADPYQQVIGVLAKCRRVLVTTHARMDGDAVGSCAALVIAMRRRNIDGQVVLLTELPRKYAFVFNENSIAYRDVLNGWPDECRLERFDALLVVDTGTWSQLPGLRERLGGWSGKTVVIDHHLTQEAWGDVRLVNSDAAASGQVVADLLDRWGVQIDRDIATALYAAVASDTGWFQFSNTRPATLRLAARLMECGVDTDGMYQAIYQNERAERLALQTRAQQSLELLADGRLALMKLRQPDFQQTHASMADTENIVNIPLQIGTVEVSMFMVEEKPDTLVRVSLRSKGRVDVARFAERFGGGGHARAAGLKLEMSLTQALTHAAGAMEDLLRGQK